MKKVYVLLIGLSLSFTGFSQSCLPDGIYFSTQAQIDSFQVNYPNCTEIEGDVTIGFYDPSDIINLNGLNVLTHVGGSLTIGNNYLLTTLTGLNNLNSIVGDLLIGFGYNIWDNGPTNLTSLTGLENLISIGGELSIAFNHNLTSLAGLENLISIGSNLEIKYNDVLTSLNALENMDTDSMYNLSIFNNPYLCDCEVQSICDYLDSLSGSVNIYNNATGCNSPQEVASNCGITLPCLPFGNYYFLSQADIDNFQLDFPNCTELEGDVTIEGSDITNLYGLNILTSIGGRLIIYDNSSLTSLTGLEGLTSTGIGFEIKNNNGLTNLSGLDGLTSIGGYLSLWYNSNIINLRGLESLMSVGGDLFINHNTSLITLTGLEGVTSVGGNLGIGDNWVLTSLMGLDNLTSIMGGLSIGSNYQLNSLAGLESLNSIGGTLRMSYNNNLISLSGLDNLTSIGGDLKIGEADWGGNPVLADISALKGLTSIGGGLMINDNDALLSLTGLDNIDAGSISDLYIANNSSLSTCDVLSICNYLASPNGYVMIEDNAPDCNSQEEVDSACVYLSNDETCRQPEFLISPNPSSTSISIELPSTIAVNNTTTLSIFNDNSQQVISRRITEPITVVDISTLHCGVYFVKIADNRTVQFGKFMKQ